ncbi:tripartite motif-containing protein 16-like isoform X1 [Alosa sapidissima]|uniref:tripartite motif-containing protein 16-like isoform X1 n=1 Tax=Alosa sapidissima TaxID=34773 RepID=UPI001C084C0C|nr:tripartite motif-containing protein 16-like isoform X1 [Alosa sapidissima]
MIDAMSGNQDFFTSPMVDELRDHDAIPSTAERKTRFRETHSKIQQRIQMKEKKLQALRKAVETLKSSAQTAVVDSERIFIEMIYFIERRRSEVKELIRAQEKAEVSRAESLLKQLEQEIAELKRRDSEMEQLLHAKDNIQFLKSLTEKSVSTLKEQLEDFCKQEVMKISAVSDVQAVLPEPVTREEFLLYFTPFTLDPNTAHRELHLSEGNRSVEWRAKVQSYSDHPERFDWPQVLCREGVSGRCYWEVEWSGENAVDIAVSYKSISRKGGCECVFGGNDQSWSLMLVSSNSSFRHNDEETKLPLVCSSKKIGVYVDHRAGTLAFYSISDTMTLLHRVQTTFTHTLYPGFLVGFRSSVKLL